MPGHASPYWAAVDFDSEGEEDKSVTNHRVYVDPWDSEALGIQKDPSDASQGDTINSFVGEPVSASFYYVPTKTCDSSDTLKTPKRSIVHDEIITPEYGYGRRISRYMISNEPDVPIYSHKPIPDRRRSVYVEEPIYTPHPMLYDSVYAPCPVPPVYMHPRHRVSLQHQPEYISANIYEKRRRPSRLADAYEQYAYEVVQPEYAEYGRPSPKAAPDNFHLSRYGHLRIDYSCSWNSLDRIIRNN